MPIPPIGSNAGQLPPLNDKRTESAQPEKVDVKVLAEKPDSIAPAGTNRIEISPEAKHIRSRQGEITSLQIAEHAAERIAATGVKVNQLVLARLEAVRQHEKNAGEIQAAIDASLRNFETVAAGGEFEGKNVLDGREMRFEVGGKTETLQTPDAKSETEAFVREIRSAVQNNRKPATADITVKMRKFASESAGIRVQLEKDVRESVAGAVRESSASRVKDAAEAERLIKQAREAGNRQASNPVQNTRGIESQAINLLK